ncbi:melanoma-associated antigen B2-like [Lepus europaeus]|uniref:melanoma-associated antigen B2-like n=1 Tax=Lepus europaeus TaxID=9983 RepID=UPI002B4834B8|nr:melanoma-associated antigen B2-like [Lepus europaeus]
MPRGQKSKLRARERRRQARSGTQEPRGAQATAAEEAELPSTSSADVGAASPSSSASGLSQGLQRAPPTATTRRGHVSRKRSSKGAKSQGEESKNPLQASASHESASRDPLSRKAGLLMQFLLYKYKLKEPIKRVELLKIISRQFRQHFPEILKKASERLELLFGLELQENKPKGQLYTLVPKLEVSSDGRQSSVWGFPRNGLLMPLLGVIFLNENCASEEEIWEFLNVLGVYDGKKHLIFGEPRKLITKDLVQEEYLEYQQVPNSDPPRYQFLWGPRAHAETSKMKVLEFLARVNNTDPTAFPTLYEEALNDEAEKARARAAATSATTKAGQGPRAKADSSSHP